MSRWMNPSEEAEAKLNAEGLEEWWIAKKILPEYLFVTWHYSRVTGLKQKSIAMLVGVGRPAVSIRLKAARERIELALEERKEDGETRCGHTLQDSHEAYFGHDTTLRSMIHRLKDRYFGKADEEES